MLLLLHSLCLLVCFINCCAPVIFKKEGVFCWCSFCCLSRERKKNWRAICVAVYDSLVQIRILARPVKFLCLINKITKTNIPHTLTNEYSVGLISVYIYYCCFYYCSRFGMLWLHVKRNTYNASRLADWLTVAL